MGYRDYYDKTLEDLILDELRYYTSFRVAERTAKERLRMYANHFCRDVRKFLINESSKCIKCGSNEKLHIDHIVPISKNGKNVLENVQILCQTCNLKKGNRIYKTFINMRDDGYLNTCTFFDSKTVRNG